MKRIAKFKPKTSDDLYNQRMKYLNERQKMRKINQQNLLIPSENGFLKKPLEQPDFLISDILQTQDETDYKTKLRNELLKLAPLTIVDNILNNDFFINENNIIQLMIVWSKFKKDLLKNFQNIDVSTFINYVEEYLKGDKPIIKVSQSNIITLKDNLKKKIENNKRILEERINKLEEEKRILEKIKKLTKQDEEKKKNINIVLKNYRKKLQKNIASQEKINNIQIEDINNQSPEKQEQLKNEIQNINNEIPTEPQSVDVSVMIDKSNIMGDDAMYKSGDTPQKKILDDLDINKKLTPEQFLEIHNNKFLSTLEDEMSSNMKIKDFEEYYNVSGKTKKRDYKNIIIQNYYNELIKEEPYKSLSENKNEQQGKGMKKKNLKKEKMRFKLLMGEILSGNDNKKLINEYNKKKQNILLRK